MAYNDESSPVSPSCRDKLSASVREHPRSPRMARELAEDRRVNGYVHDGFYRTEFTADEPGVDCLATQERGALNAAPADLGPRVSDVGAHYGETLPEATYRVPLHEEEEGPWKAS